MIMRIRVATLSALALLAAPTGPFAPSLHAAEPQPAEAFTYHFSVGPIDGGRARLAIGQPFDRDQRSFVAVRGEAETAPWLKAIAPLRDEYQVLLSMRNQMPVEVATIETGLRNRKTKTVFDESGQKADVTVEGGRHSLIGKRTLPAAGRDPVSLYLHLRRQPLKTNDELTEYLLDRSYLSRINLKVLGRETIFLDQAHMKARAIKVSAVSQRVDDAGNPLPLPARPFLVWLTDDRDRVLLRMEVDAEMGKATIELTSYTKGALAQRN